MRVLAALVRLSATALMYAATVPLFAADGDVRWKIKTGGVIDSSPAVATDGSGTIFVGVASGQSIPVGLLLALKSDRSELWRFPKVNEPSIRGIVSSPALSGDGKTVYFGCEDGLLYALDAVTGNKRWSFDTHSAAIYNSPTVNPVDGTVYIISDDQVLHAVQPDGSKERWSRSNGLPSLFDSSVAIGRDGTLYFASADQSIYALNPNDGTVRWGVSLGASPTTPFAIGPDGTVYVGVLDYTLAAISPEGGLKWKFPVGDLIFAAPSIAADGTIYFASFDGKFYAVNPGQTVKWVKNIGANVASAAAVRGDGTIIFGANDYFVRALNADGSLKWALGTDEVVVSSPAIASDGTIYVGSDDTNLYAITGSGSPLSTVSSWPMLHGDTQHSGTVRPTTAGGYLINLSTLALAGGSSNLIVGFVVQGQVSKRFLIRAIGPTLGAIFGVPNTLGDPAVSVVFAPTGAEVAANNDWSGPDHDNFFDVLNATIDTFSLSVGEKDAAVAPLLSPGRYSAVVKSSDGGTGVALVEAYDAEKESGASRLVNLSTRAQSGSGASVLTAGLVIGGSGPLRVLLRVVGPGLAQFGVSGYLAQPIMTVYNASNQQVIRRNTGWTSEGLTEDLAAAARLTGAFTLSPTGAGAADCAAVLALLPGNYTIQVSGVGGTTGEALVEVYAVP